MKNPELPPDKPSEKKELSFTEGLIKVMETIVSLHAQQDYVVITISGPLKDDTNVGKTTLVGKLSQELITNGVPVISVGDIKDLSSDLKTDLEQDQINRGSKKGVVIFGAERSGGNLPPENPMFHLTRAVHMAGRCIDCNLCTEVCPADIPLRTLYKKVAEIVKDEFGYVTGEPGEGKSPLNILGPDPGHTSANQ